MKKNVFVFINLLMILALAGYIFFNKSQQKNAYILNQKLFDGFRGKVELEKKLGLLRSENKKKMDSLNMLIQSNADNTNLVNYYSETLSNYEMTEKQVSDQYTADIWKRLNEYISDFGKENNYDFIFGAIGNGNLMYANDSKDVTDEAIKYVNHKYEKGE